MRLLVIALSLYAYVVVAGELWAFKDDIAWLAIWPIIIAIGFISIFVHELGHAAAIVWAGGRVDRFAVVPFELRFRPLRMKVLPPRSTGDIGGYVARVPGWATSNRRHIIISAAGPFANFLLAGLAAAVAYALMMSVQSPIDGVPDPSSSGLLPESRQIAATVQELRNKHYLEGFAAVLRAMALFSAIMGAINLIPFAGSDGQSILRRLKRRTAS